MLARALDSLHGDNHPAVSIKFDKEGLVYQYDDDGYVESIELDVWIDGCVPGLDYLVLVEEIEENAPRLMHPAPKQAPRQQQNTEMNWTVLRASNMYASQSWSQHITMLDDRPFFPSLYVKGEFRHLSAKDKRRFQVQFALPSRPLMFEHARTHTHIHTYSHNAHARTRTHEHRWCLSTPIPVFQKKSAGLRRRIAPSNRLPRLDLDHVWPDANASNQTTCEIGTQGSTARGSPWVFCVHTTSTVSTRQICQRTH